VQKMSARRYGRFHTSAFSRYKNGGGGLLHISIRVLRGRLTPRVDFAILLSVKTFRRETSYRLGYNTRYLSYPRVAVKERARQHVTSKDRSNIVVGNVDRRVADPFKQGTEKQNGVGFQYTSSSSPVGPSSSSRAAPVRYGAPRS